MPSAQEYYDGTMMSHIAKANWKILCSRQWDDRYCWLANVINVYLSGRDKNWPKQTDECVEAGAAFVKTWLGGSFRYIDCPREKGDLLEEYLNIHHNNIPNFYQKRESFVDTLHNSEMCSMHLEICKKLLPK